MPGFFPGRPGGERGEPLLDMIFDRRPLPPGAPPEMHDLARMLAVMAGPAEPGELAGEATALAAFARLAPRSASRPLLRGQPGVGRPDGQVAPDSPWLRRCSRQQPGWAALPRLTSACCPARSRKWRT
ncbi:MAG: hypothetical protein ACLP8X_38495 [Streptosporangiaceae bacterium]